MTASRQYRRARLRRWTLFLLALLFLVTASEQAMHAHRSAIPASTQLSDSLDSNAAARCHLCLHSQAAPLGSVVVSVSPYVAVAATVAPSPLAVHKPGEEWVQHVRPPPSA